jgi:hypothetical protein
LSKTAKTKKKKPQLPRDHPEVVAGAAHRRVYRIAERASEPVTIKFFL